MIPRKELPMALNSKEQINLAEAAIAVQNQRNNLNESQEELSENDAIALSFIQSALGEDILNESSEENYAVAVNELVESLNHVCFAVNDFFGLYED